MLGRPPGKKIEDPACRTQTKSGGDADDRTVAVAIERTVSLDGTGCVRRGNWLPAEHAGDAYGLALAGRTVVLAQPIAQLGQQWIVGRPGQVVDIDDLSRTTHDPLLAQLRYRLRKHHGAPREGKTIGIPSVFSREPVAPPDASCAVEGDGSLNCHGYGSVVSVTATFGLCAAGWVLDFLARRTSEQ